MNETMWLSFIHSPPTGETQIENRQCVCDTPGHAQTKKISAREVLCTNEHQENMSVYCYVRSVVARRWSPHKV